MDLQVLRFYVTVAQEGGFTAASEKLHYAQSNLSTRIRQLEEELGEELFYRHKRGVSLTAKGKIFYDYANRILQLSDEAVTAIRDMDHARGTLTIGSVEATALGDLPQFLSAYHREFPDVTLSLTTDMNDVFIGQVLSRKLDGAFVAESPAHHELAEVFVKKERLTLVRSAQDSEVDIWELLEKEPLITFPEGSIFRRRLELLLSSREIHYADRLVFLNSLGAMIGNIIAGIGIGYLPESIVETYIKQGLMKRFPIEDPYADLRVVFIYRRDHIMNAAFRYFLERLRESAD